MLITLRDYIKAHDLVDDVFRVSQQEKIADVDQYGITLETGVKSQYKGRKGKEEATIFVNCFAKGAESSNADINSKHLAAEINKHLDEMSEAISTQNIKFYIIKYISSPEEAEYVRDLNAYRFINEYVVRWEEI